MMDITQKQKLSQQQQISSQQLQSLSLLSIPVLELQEKIDDIMNSNPVLEYENAADSSLLRELPDASIEDEKSFPSDDEYSEMYDSDHDSWHDELPIPDKINDFNAEQHNKRDYFFSNITEAASMQQQLMQELNFLNLNSDDYKLAEAVVGAIDENGFLSTPLADIAQYTDTEIFEVEDMLRKLQKIFPPGVGARDLKECLRLQLEANGETDEKLFELIDNLEDFGNNRLEHLAKKMGISIHLLNELGDKLRKLNPHPAGNYTSPKTGFIMPEVEIIRNENDELILKSHNELFPQLKISEEYQKMLAKPDISPDVREYLKQKIQEANIFKTSLAMREKTIVRIAQFILLNQTEFMLNGIQSLKPMTMAQAAEALDIHETTVSRGCANKYISTPQGLFEFKFFFSGGFRNETGDDVSTHAIQEKIREFIEDEDPYKPLSDEKISAMLADNGFKVARRTVAKYREQMNILPTNLRRKH